jgi:hypothetical protein
MIETEALMYIQVGLRSHAANRKRAGGTAVCHWLVAGAKKFHALIGIYACKDVETGRAEAAAQGGAI